MKRISKEVEHKYITKEIRYVADDGAEFMTSEDCEKYEREMAIDEAMKRHDIISIPVDNESLVCFFADRYEGWDQHFVLTSPMTEEAAKFLDKAYEDDFHIFTVGEYTCVRLQQGAVYDIASEKEMKKFVREWFGLIGYDVEFRKRSEK